METIQIQSIGKVAAKKVKDFKIGEKIMWNFGYYSEILGIASETKSFVDFEMNSMEPCGKTNGKIYIRRMKKDRLAAIYSR